MSIFSDEATRTSLIYQDLANAANYDRCEAYRRYFQQLSDLWTEVAITLGRAWK